MSDSIVIIPTYNEKENIEGILRKVFSLTPSFHVLIVDDGSPDGTAKIVQQLQLEFPDRLFLEERKGKLGLGTAYIHGFKWCIARSYAYIFEMDADFSHNPDDLIRLRQACVEGADVAVGSRYKGVNVVNWPMSRVLMSYFASAYVRMITGIHVQDATAGFVCYKKSVLEKIPLDQIRFEPIFTKIATIKHSLLSATLQENFIVLIENAQLDDATSSQPIALMEVKFHASRWNNRLSLTISLNNMENNLMYQSHIKDIQFFLENSYLEFSNPVN